MLWWVTPHSREVSSSCASSISSGIESFGSGGAAASVWSDCGSVEMFSDRMSAHAYMSVHVKWGYG